jgi:hypothetical protein
MLMLIDLPLNIHLCRSQSYFTMQTQAKQNFRKEQVMFTARAKTPSGTPTPR